MTAAAMRSSVAVELARELEAFRAEHGVPGAAAVLFGPDGILAGHATGVLSADRHEPLTTETLFRVNSVSKMLTCTAAMILVGEGRLALSDELSGHLPDGPARELFSGIRLGHLLTHTSGLLRGTRSPGHRTAIDFASAAGALGRPGEVYEYSDAGIALVGHVIEQCTGRPFPDAMRSVLFDRAGMRTCCYDPLVAMTHPLSQRHVHNVLGAVEVMRRFDHDVLDYPYAGLYCSVADLARFGALHLSARTRDDAVSRSVRAMRRPATELGLDIDLGYGTGCYVGPRYGPASSFGQVGYYLGSWTRLTIVDGPPDVGVAWCDNLGHDELPIEARQQVIERLLALVGAGPADWTRRAPAVRPYRLAALPGEYRRHTGRSVHVHVDGDRVRIGDGTFSAPLRDLGDGVLVFENEADRPAGLPWRPHDYSDRCCVSFVGGDAARASHVVLNGTAFPALPPTREGDR